LSRQVIHDIVIPIVARILERERYISGFAGIEDRNLEEFLEEELKFTFGLCGSARTCEKLKEALEQRLREDPKAVEVLIKHLVMKYVRLKTSIRTGPPDRFQKLREKGKEIWAVA